MSSPGQDLIVLVPDRDVEQVKPSAAVFRKIADSVSLAKCTDASFVSLCEQLRAWFPVTSSEG